MRADFLTAAPDDLRDLNTARDSLPFREMFCWPHVAQERGVGLNVAELKEHAGRIRTGTGEYSERARWQSVVRNPVAATVHFDRGVTIMLREKLGIDPTRCKSPPFRSRRKGVVGRLRGCAASLPRCGGFGVADMHGAGLVW
eukprot:COSAG01_NODE_3050_length_6663_cov_4.316118_2_plen_142_part_00